MPRTPPDNAKRKPKHSIPEKIELHKKIQKMLKMKNPPEDVINSLGNVTLNAVCQYHGLDTSRYNAYKKELQVLGKIK